MKRNTAAIVGAHICAEYPSFEDQAFDDNVKPALKDSMNEPSPEPLMTWRFIRVNAARIIIGTVLVTAVSVAVFVWMPYQREQRIAQKVKALGGMVEWNYIGPNWIPQSIRVRLPIWRSLEGVNLWKPLPPNLLLELRPMTNMKHLHLYDQGVGDAGLDQLETLTHLETLVIHGKYVTNAGLEHLTSLTSLKCLYLNNTQINDAGLKRLEGLTQLTVLNLHNTQTTSSGREHLRKVLPNCTILPRQDDSKPRRILMSPSISK